MKKAYLSIALVLCSTAVGTAQTYPFQNPALADEKRIDNLVSLLTLDEKIHLLSTRPSVERLGIKGTRIVEGLHGLALSGPANWAVKGKGEAPTTTFPQAYGLAHTWDADLIQRVASWEADECRYLTQSPKYASAGLIVLAPNADLGRDIRWGRTEECYGEDPFLAASLTVAFVKGLQGNHPKYWKTASLMKHFLANSNENNRSFNSSDFDERLFREYYGYAFYKGITEAGARAFMTAYNAYNGIPCTVHPVVRKVAINEWGQNGIVATDGGAYRQLVSSHGYSPDLWQAAASCIKAGTNMFLDNYKEPLKQAVEMGLLTDEELNLSVRGTLRVMLKLGLLDASPLNPYSKMGIADTVDLWTKPEARQLAREATAKSVVLLKNSRALLPIDNGKIKSIAVIGPSGHSVISDWYAGTPPYAVSVLQGVKNTVGSNVEVFYAGSNKADSAVIAASKADLAIVCVGNHPLGYNLPWEVNHVYSDGREGVDRQAISLEQEDLVRLVYAANPNTVMVVVSSFPYAINWSAENVPAIVHISQSSQELGNGLADVLFGKTNPAGRLVQTWPASIDHLPPMLDYNIRHGRTYMYSKHKPLFPFGHGLSYTSFAYSSLKIDKQIASLNQPIRLSLNVTNTGGFDGDEVVQVYGSFPNSTVERPTLALKGFKRVFVPKGQTVNVVITINPHDLAYWDVDSNSFKLEKGVVCLQVGASSSDLRLSESLEVKVDLIAPPTSTRGRL